MLSTGATSKTLLAKCCSSAAFAKETAMLCYWICLPSGFLTGCGWPRLGWFCMLTDWVYRDALEFGQLDPSLCHLVLEVAEPNIRVVTP